MTLTEVLVVMSLFLGAMLLIATLFSYVSRSTGRQHARVDSQTRVLQACRLISKELSNSPRSGQLYFYQNDPGPLDDLAIAALTTVDASGARGWDNATHQPLYQGYNVFFRDLSDDTLKSYYTTITSTPVIIPPTEPQVRTEWTSATTKLLAERVTSFQLRSLTDDSVLTEPSNPVDIAIGYRLTDQTPLECRFSVKCVMP